MECQNPLKDSIITNHKVIETCNSVDNKLKNVKIVYLFKTSFSAL